MKRELKIKRIEYNAEGKVAFIGGVIEKAVTILPTESFDHCQFLEITRLEGEQ